MASVYLPGIPPATGFYVRNKSLYESFKIYIDNILFIKHYLSVLPPQYLIIKKAYIFQGDRYPRHI